MPPRLTKGSKAVRILRGKFENGAISGQEDPKSVWLSDPVFQGHKLSNFRTFYHNIKKEMGEYEGEIRSHIP